MSERTQIARNALSSYAVRGLLALSALLLTPYLYRRLGSDGFGTWSVIFTLWTVFELLETGFSSGVVKYVSEYRGRGDREALQRTIGIAVVLMTLLGLVALGLSALAATLLDGLAAEAYRDDFTLGMLVLGVAQFIRYPCVTYGAVLNGYQRYDLYNLSEGLVVVGLAVGAVAAVEAGTGVLGITVVFGGTLIASGLLAAILLRRVDRDLSLRPRLGDGSARRTIARFSSLVLLADSMVFIAQRMDVVFIAAIRNAATAAPYAAALKLQSGVQALTLPFARLLMPMVSDLWARGERDEVIRRMTLATRVAAQLTVPVAFGIALFSPDLVDLWLGKGAPDVTAWIIATMMAVQISTLAAVAAERVLVGIGRVRLISALAVVEGVANVATSVTLIWYFGAIGAAIGTLVTTALISPIKMPLACRATGCSTLRFLGVSVGWAVLSSLPGLAVMGAAWLLLPHGTARATVGLGAGLLVCAVVATVQIGPARVVRVLRSGFRRIPSAAAGEGPELGSPAPERTPNYL